VLEPIHATGDLRAARQRGADGVNVVSLRHAADPSDVMRDREPDAPPVILVDEEDREIGLAPKLDAHARGALHRAVSVFAFDARGLLVLQRRARTKYHSGGLWSNAACTHPRSGESTEEAARRCLREEMGLDATFMLRSGALLYRAHVGDGLEEHELDHLFVARVDQTPAPNASEVEEWRAIPLRDAEREVAEAPQRFTAWFPLALSKVTAGELVARVLQARRDA